MKYSLSDTTDQRREIDVKTDHSPAPGEAASPALSLVNTCVVGPRGTVDALTGVDELGDWMRCALRRDSSPVRAADLQTAIELRSAIRALFTSATAGAGLDATASSIVNRVAASDPGAPQLISTRTPAGSGWVGNAQGSVSAALAQVARDAIVVLTTPTALRQCAAFDCDRIFIPDHARRIWCSTTCGNRVRAARHHRRQRQIAI